MHIRAKTRLAFKNWYAIIIEKIFIVPLNMGVVENATRVDHSSLYKHWVPSDLDIETYETHENRLDSPCLNIPTTPLLTDFWLALVICLACGIKL